MCGDGICHTLQVHSTFLESAENDQYPNNILINNLLLISHGREGFRLRSFIVGLILGPFLVNQTLHVIAYGLRLLAPLVIDDATLNGQIWLNIGASSVGVGPQSFRIGIIGGCHNRVVFLLDGKSQAILPVDVCVHLDELGASRLVLGPIQVGNHCLEEDFVLFVLGSSVHMSVPAEDFLQCV